MWNSVLVTKLNALRQGAPSFVADGKDGSQTSPFAYGSLDSLLAAEANDSALLNFSFKNSIFDLDNFEDDEDSGSSVYEFSVYNTDGEEEECGLVSNEDVMSTWVKQSEQSHDAESVGRAAHALECAFVDALSSSFWSSTHNDDLDVTNSRPHSMFQRPFSIFGENELDEQITHIEREIARVEEQKRKLHTNSSFSSSSSATSSPIHHPAMIMTSSPTASPSHSATSSSNPASPFSSNSPSSSSPTLGSSASPSARKSSSSANQSPISPIPSLKRSSSFPLSFQNNNKSSLVYDESESNSSMTSPCASPSHDGDDTVVSVSISPSREIVKHHHHHSPTGGKTTKSQKRHRLTSSASSSSTKPVNNSSRKSKLNSSMNNIHEKDSHNSSSSSSKDTVKRRKVSSKSSSTSSSKHHKNEIFKLEQVLKIQTASNEADEDEEVDIL